MSCFNELQGLFLIIWDFQAPLISCNLISVFYNEYTLYPHNCEYILKKMFNSLTLILTLNYFFNQILLLTLMVDLHMKLMSLWLGYKASTWYAWV